MQLAFDPISQTLRAISVRSALAPALALAAGAATSIGPCVAPRFLAVAAIASGRPRKAAFGIVCVFVTGLTVAYAAFGLVASLLGTVVQFAGEVYALSAVGLTIGGAALLLREESAACEQARRVRSGGSLGAIFLLGVAAACVVSPCCTPVVVGVLAYTTEVGSPLYGAALLAIFAIGHAMPLFGAGFATSGTVRALMRANVQGVASVVGGTLMLALGVYYAVLA